MRFATDGEAETGGADDKAVTPRQLKKGLNIEAEARTTADTGIKGDVSDLRADLEAWMSTFGVRTWQEFMDDFPTWQDVLNAGTWLKVYMKGI
jgi:hypothetical protein